MKKLLCVIMFFVIYLNHAQDFKEINAKKRDIIVFENPSNLKTNDFFFYKKDGLVLGAGEWSHSTGYGAIHKVYFFINERDTMIINCSCGQYRNFYFKNLKFQKGNYHLNFEMVKKFNNKTKMYDLVSNSVLGKEINTPKKVQHILFLNSYTSDESLYKDIYFKDLKFKVVDFNDTIRNKLKKVDILFDR